MKTFSLGLLLALAVPALAALRDLELRLQDATGHERYQEASRIYEGIKKSGDANVESYYWAGIAYMHLNLFDEARRAFQAASQPGWEPRPDWPQPQEFSERLEALSRFAPPRLPSADASLTVFGGTPTAWTGPVLNAVPAFEAAGRGIFGKALPEIRFYLFSDRAIYRRFFEAAFGQTFATSWQDGTGNTHIVVYCEAASRPAGDPETVGNVLHEFGHAWLNSYFRINFDKDYLASPYRSPYTDEGLADLVATLWDKEHLSRRLDWVRREKVAKGIEAPRFDDLKSYDDFYKTGDIDLHYWLSALLVSRLMGPKGSSKISAYLEALAKTGDATKALAKVSGLDPAREYQAMVKEIWARP
jgi:hypothetical protein